jgi:hypothetical protein
LGFICEDDKIKCSGCSFKCANASIDSFLTLVKEHLKAIEFGKKQNSKCPLKNFHLEYVKFISKNKNSENIKKIEKPQNKYSSFGNRLATFDNKELEINTRELAENGMFLVEDQAIKQALSRKIKCYYCSY